MITEEEKTNSILLKLNELNNENDGTQQFKQEIQKIQTKFTNCKLKYAKLEIKPINNNITINPGIIILNNLMIQGYNAANEKRITNTTLGETIHTIQQSKTTRQSTKPLNNNTTFRYKNTITPKLTNPQKQFTTLDNEEPICPQTIQDEQKIGNVSNPTIVMNNTKQIA